VGDIWPCHPPWRTTWQDCYNAVFAIYHNDTTARIMAAVAEAEGSFDLAVINDTPSTGDYSVGTWQINYYDGLYSGREAAFGTPCQLIHGGLPAQAHAAAVILNQQGPSAWSTYTSGAYKQYLHGGGTTPGVQPGPGLYSPAPPPPKPGRDDYSPTVHAVAVRLKSAGVHAIHYATDLSRLR